MTAESMKSVYALLSLYSLHYKKIYGSAPRINKYREKWGMHDVLDSVGFDTAKELLEYYFKTDNPGHQLTWFYNNFDKLEEALDEKKRDRERFRALLEKTEKRVREESELRGKTTERSIEE